MSNKNTSEHLQCYFIEKNENQANRISKYPVENLNDLMSSNKGANVFEYICLDLIAFSDVNQTCPHEFRFSNINAHLWTEPS